MAVEVVGPVGDGVFLWLVPTAPAASARVVEAAAAAGTNLDTCGVAGCCCGRGRVQRLQRQLAGTATDCGNHGGRRGLSVLWLRPRYQIAVFAVTAEDVHFEVTAAARDVATAAASRV